MEPDEAQETAAPVRTHQSVVREKLNMHELLEKADSAIEGLKLASNTITVTES